MEKQQDRIRIKDIAQMAGVSVGTVDRVLHSRSGVSESSRIKVEEILKKLNYQPNMYASALASNKKYRFAYLLPSHNEGDYWKDVERGMQQAITRFSDFNSPPHCAKEADRQICISCSKPAHWHTCWADSSASSIFLPL
jgi:LacI family transcriptional regulator